jgi:hypothetical protein
MRNPIPACVGEIRNHGAATVFARDDMVDLERDVGCFLRQSAVFAPSGSSLTHLLVRIGDHSVSEPFCVS